MKLVTELASLQQQLAQDGKSDQLDSISNLLNEIVPDWNFTVKKAAARNVVSAVGATD